jgi:alpha-tubulin suppressor-like RCC1 family protein
MNNSEKDEPAEIQTFQNIKIKQIFAAGNSSFATTEGGNNIYAWGNNDRGQLGLNYERTPKISEPKLVGLTEKFSNETVIYQNKDGTQTFLAECKI